MNVGIIGRGYVGSAIAASYRPDELLINDPAYPDISRPLSELKDKSDAILSAYLLHKAQTVHVIPVF
jgi:hypothetical protein